MARVSLNLTGMSCSACEQRIDAVLKRLDGIGRVSADYRAATVVVDYDPEAVEEATILGRLAAAGYNRSEDEQIEAGPKEQ